MSTITAKVLIDSVAKTLQDDTNTKWLRPELLGYLNDGQREIVLAKSDAYVKNGLHQLVPGTRQTIPADGIMFVRILRNMGLNGTTPGRVPRPIDHRILDEQIPDWHAATPAATMLHYAFQEGDPKHFYAYPPQPSPAGQVDIIYSANPPDVPTENDVLTLDDVYKTALEHYMLSRAYSKDAEYAREDAAAGAHYSVFASLIGLKERADQKQAIAAAK